MKKDSWWQQILSSLFDKLEDQYNNTYHGSINKKPIHADSFWFD